MKPKHVWIVNHYAQAPDGAGGTRHYQIARHLPDYGWQPLIISGSCDYSNGHQRLSFLEFSRHTKYPPVSFLIIKTIHGRNNLILRILSMLLFSLSLLWLPRYFKIKKPDLVIGSSVHPFAAFSAYILSLYYGCPFVFEVRDLWPQTLIDFNIIQYNGIFARLLRALEHFLYKHSVKIISLLPDAYKYMQTYGIDKNKIVWIPNGVDLESWPVYKPLPFANKKRVFRILYFGSHGVSNSLHTIIDSIALYNIKYPSSPISVTFVGDGPLKSALINKSQELNLSNTFFMDTMKKSSLPLFSSSFDCLILALKDSNVYKYGISLNKLYDYLACSRPVIFASSASNNPVLSANAGVSVRSEDSNGLCDAIHFILSLNDIDRYEMGLRARKYTENFHNSKNLSHKLVNLMDSIA